MKIFLSHIHEEKPLALTIKEWIQSTFPGKCEVFVSSALTDILPGAPWKQRIREALEDASLVVVLASPASLARPWVNFEAGCGWMKGVDLLCVCHSGQTIGELPAPLDDFNGLQLSDPEFGQKLVASVAARIGVKAPPIAYADMATDLAAALGRIQPSAQAHKSEPADDLVGLSEDQIEILKYIPNAQEHVYIDALAKHFDMHWQKMKWNLEELESKGLITHSGQRMEPSYYYLKPKGRAFLVQRGIL